MAMTLHANPFTTSPNVCRSTTNNSCTCRYLATPTIFPDGRKLCYSSVNGNCSSDNIVTTISGDDSVVAVNGYICVCGTNCIYTIRIDNSGYGSLTSNTLGTNKYTICSPGGVDVYYSYNIFYLDK